MFYLICSTSVFLQACGFVGLRLIVLSEVLRSEHGL
jgi:hypothetical protein